VNSDLVDHLHFQADLMDVFVCKLMHYGAFHEFVALGDDQLCYLSVPGGTNVDAMVQRSLEVF